MTLSSAVAFGGLAGVAACSGSTETTGRTTGAGGSNGSPSGSGTPSTSAATTAPIMQSTTSPITMPMGTSGGGGPQACQSHDITFTPDIPTVLVLVDRSSSMWDNNYWDPLREGVLEVVQRLHEEIRFGFATFTGIVGQTCPLDFATAERIDLNNYQSIADFWNGIERPNVATETPTAAAIQEATQLLLADGEATPGPKYILLVTDGNPDYCDNGWLECRADTLVRQLQNAAAPPTNIQTFVVALPDPGIDQAWLKAYANAGAGQGVTEPSAGSVLNCPTVPMESAALFPEPFPQADYTGPMGPAEPFTVDPAQREDLVSQLGALVAGVKSCVFDLEGELQIVSGLENQGSVSIETTLPSGEVGLEAQPYDPMGVNGWHVLEGGTQVALVGTSCDKLRSPETTGVDFGFPCGIVTLK